MTVYFTASIVGKRYHLSNYLKIIEWLTAQKFRVIADHIIKTSESEIILEGRQKRLEFHRNLHRWIISCNCMVVEATFPSVSVGYEIALALSCGKPVLILYSEGNAPVLLTACDEEKLICSRYSQKNLARILTDFIGFVEGINDIRFNFFVTSFIASYLDEVSRKEKLPKSVYLRKLIEADMKKHSSYSPSMHPQ